MNLASIRYTSTTDGTTYRYVVSNGTAATIDSGVTVDTAFHVFRVEGIQSPANGFRFSIDGGAVKTACNNAACDLNTTHIPTGTMGPFATISGLNTAQQYMDVDVFLFTATVTR
jgi:hypothetical protein